MSEIQETSEQVPLMDSKTMEDHKLVAFKLDWDSLAAIIIDMEMELHELKPYMSTTDKARLEQVIEIYELAKARLVAVKSKGTDYAKFFFGDDGSSDGYY